MMKEEFEKLVGKQVTNDEYRDIELVYAFHPLISNQNGKQEVAELYRKYGIVLIRDMTYRAKRCQHAESQIAALQAQINHIMKEANEQANERIEAIANLRRQLRMEAGRDA